VHRTWRSVNDNVIYVHLQGSTGGSLSPVTSLTLNSLTGTPLNGLQDSLSNAYSNLQQYAGNYPARHFRCILTITEIQTENVTLYPREHTKVPSFLTSELCALKLSLERRRWPWKRKSCIVSNNEYTLSGYVYSYESSISYNIKLFIWLTFRSTNFSSVFVQASCKIDHRWRIVKNRHGIWNNLIAVIKQENLASTF